MKQQRVRATLRIEWTDVVLASVPVGLTDSWTNFSRGLENGAPGDRRTRATRVASKNPPRVAQFFG